MYPDPNLGQLCAVLTGSTDKINDYSSAHFLARQNIEAFGHRHLLTVCKTLAISIDDGLDRIAPCTPLQEGIISRSLRSETPIYFEKFHFKLSETVEIDRLKHAWAQVITSTEMLRTRFSPTVDGYAQAVCKKVQLPWYEEGFSSEGELEDFKNRRYHSWWTGNRELSGSMFEIIVLQCGKRKLMCLYIFHALYDGQSLPRILNNVMLEYAGVLEVNYGPSFHEILPFGPLCLANGAKEFWRSHLGGLSYQPLPTSSIPSSQAANSAFLELPPLSINDAKRRYNTTHQSIVQAAWYIVLRRHFPSQVALGIVISGRSIDFEDADKVIGPLFNTIPFHFDVGSCRSWAEAVEHCHEFNSAVLPFQHSSLHDVMKWCHRSSEQPLFETLFVFQRELTKASEITDPIWKQLETAPIADVSLVTSKPEF